jgi:hypothetical protein
MYSLELLQSINDWQSTGMGTNKTQIAERIIEHSKEINIKFKSLNAKCYRQIALTGMNSVLLGANMRLPETYSSWSFDRSVVQSFNGGVPPVGRQGIIFEVDNTVQGVEVILNLYELFKDETFLEACEKHKNDISSYKSGIGYFLNKEAEIILKVEYLTTNQIWAYGGYSAPREKLAEMYFGHVASPRELIVFDRLINQGNIIIGGNWVTGSAKNRIVNLHIATAQRLTNRNNYR